MDITIRISGLKVHINWRWSAGQYSCCTGLCNEFVGRASNWTGIKLDGHQIGRASNWTGIKLDGHQIGQASNWTGIKLGQASNWTGIKLDRHSTICSNKYTSMYQPFQ